MEIQTSVHSMARTVLLLIWITVHLSRPLVTSLPTETPPREFICDSKPADVMFILDESNSIWRPHFENQLKTFVKSVIDSFIISDKNIRVAAMTFSDNTIQHFDFKAYDDKESLKKAFDQIHQQGGVHTFTYDALKYMREFGFSHGSGVREGIIKVCIIITDGQSDNTLKTVEEAMKAHRAGIHVFAIGVGLNIDRLELKGIASPPADDYMFMVNSFEGLSKIKETLAIKTCEVTNPPTTTTSTTSTTTTAPPPTIRFQTMPVAIPLYIPTTPENQALEGPGTHFKDPSGDDRGRDNENDINWRPHGSNEGCIPKQPLHIAFIVDEKQGGPLYRRSMWKLVRDTISKLNFDDGDFRISFIRECADIPEIKLSDFDNKSDLLDHLANINPDIERTPGLLRSMVNTFRDHANTVNDPDSTQRHRVGVYITDGASNQLELTLREAQTAKHDENVEIFGVGITDSVSAVEMNSLVSCEPHDHLMSAANHRDAFKLHKKLAHKICKASPRQIASDDL